MQKADLAFLYMVMVERQCKRLPQHWQQRWQCKPHSEQDQNKSDTAARRAFR